jgi:hypothetical protein
VGGTEMYPFCSRLVSFLFSQNFGRVSHTFSVVGQKESGLLTTYLFQRKTENFTQPSTGHGRHIGKVDVKFCAFLINTLWKRDWLDPELAWIIFQEENSVLVL